MIRGYQTGMDTRLMKRNAKRGAKGIGKVQISAEKVKPGALKCIVGLNVPLELWIKSNNLRK